MSERPILCKNCSNRKGKMVGYVSSVYWCGLVGDGYNGTSIGVYPHKRKPHPKCPVEHSELYRKSNSGKLIPIKKKPIKPSAGEGEHRE